LISLVAVSIFALIIIVVLWFTFDLLQRKKKLLPEFINGKPTIMYFWVDNHRCRKMNSAVEKIKNEYSGSLKVLTFNAIKDYKTSETYLVFNVPMIILFDREGNQVIRVTEPNELPKLEKKIKEII
jgi:thioredoxin-like negative regulator of GroEL